MDSSAVSWLSEMGLDNPVFTDEFEFMDSFDQDLSTILGGGDFETCLSPDKNSSSPSSTLINIPSTNSITSLCNVPITSEPPAKLQKPNNHSTFSNLATPDHRPTSAPIILNFGNIAENSNPQPVNPRPLNPEEEAVVSEALRSQGSFDDHEELAKRAQNMTKKSRVRPPSQTYDHIVAERKRREQLSQRFVALSTIVPGLKKTDKTSVLGDAIKYLKYLQERVNTLEEQATKKTMESVVLVKKSSFTGEDDDGSSDENRESPLEQPLPEIEARACGRQILIRIHCENHKGLLTNLISRVEELNLTIVNTNVTSFGKLTLHISIITEMENEFDFSVNEVVRRIRLALQRTE